MRRLLIPRKNKELGNMLHKEEKLKYLNNINNINKIKVYKLCSNCNRKYSLDMQYCPKCHELLFPVPESP